MPRKKNIKNIFYTIKNKKEAEDQEKSNKSSEKVPDKSACEVRKTSGCEVRTSDDDGDISPTSEAYNKFLQGISCKRGNTMISKKINAMKKKVDDKRGTSPDEAEKPKPKSNSSNLEASSVEEKLDKAEDKLEKVQDGKINLTQNQIENLFKKIENLENIIQDERKEKQTRRQDKESQQKAYLEKIEQMAQGIGIETTKARNERIRLQKEREEAQRHKKIIRKARGKMLGF